MKPPIELISTDFDGTLFAEFENPPVPDALQALIAELQVQGTKLVINTGRDLSSLMEAKARARLRVKPDYVVVVEREIYRHHDHSYSPVPEWNDACARTHEVLFARVRRDLPRLVEWVEARGGEGTEVYEDAWSPFCITAASNPVADTIQTFVDEYCREVPGLTWVRNDVYARFAHADYNKGTALGEVARRLGVRREGILAAGDHFNDLPMLRAEVARWLVAPSNAMPAVKEQVRREGGWVSEAHCWHAVLEGLQAVLTAARGPA